MKYFQILIIVAIALYILLNLLTAALSGFDRKNTECDQNYINIAVGIILAVVLYYCGTFSEIF